MEFKQGECVFVWTTEARGVVAPQEHHLSGYGVVLRSDDKETQVELWPAGWESMWVQVGDRVIWSDEQDEDGLAVVPTSSVFSLAEVGQSLEPGCERPTRGTWVCPEGCEPERVLICGGLNPCEEGADALNVYFYADLSEDRSAFTYTRDGYGEARFYSFTDEEWDNLHSHADGGCCSEPQCPECGEDMDRTGEQPA